MEGKTNRGFRILAVDSAGRCLDVAVYQVQLSNSSISLSFKACPYQRS